MSKQWEEFKKLHDGHNIVAESIMFSGHVDQDNPATFSERLMVRDVEGKEIDIFLPYGFAFSIMQAVNRAITDKEEKTEEGFQQFAKQYRLYFDHKADTDVLRAVFFRTPDGICFIESNLTDLDTLDDLTLSEETLAVKDTEENI